MFPLKIKTVGIEGYRIMEMLKCLRGTRVNNTPHQIQDAKRFKTLCIVLRKKFSPSVERPSLGGVKSVDRIESLLDPHVLLAL